MRVLAIAAAVAAIPQVPLMPDSYSLLCTATKATGFKWIAGEWQQVTFKPDSYIVLVGPSNECFKTIEPVNVVSDSFVARQVCMNVRDTDEEYQGKFSDVCSEYYVYNEGKWARSFSCDGLFSGDIAGRFDGMFRRSVAGQDFRSAAESPRKDSLVIEVGRCSRVM